MNEYFIFYLGLNVGLTVCMYYRDWPEMRDLGTIMLIFLFLLLTLFMSPISLLIVVMDELEKISTLSEYKRALRIHDERKTQEESLEEVSPEIDKY